MPVVPRGGGSGTRGNVAPYGIALDLTRMNRILEIDHTSLVVTAEAGIDGPALEDELNAVGLTMPHYPGSFHFERPWAASSPRADQGCCRPSTARPRIWCCRCRRRCRRAIWSKRFLLPAHASGPDLVQVLVGSEGTLGVIRRRPCSSSRFGTTRIPVLRLPVHQRGNRGGPAHHGRQARPAVVRLYDETQKLACGSMPM